MNQMIEKLRLLKESGMTINEDSFTIMYNRFTDSFLLEVPNDRKQCGFSVGEKEYYWDASGMYPYTVRMGKLSYESVWGELLPYSQGANLDLIPLGYADETGEYIYVDDDEEGVIALNKSGLQIL